MRTRAFRFLPTLVVAAAIAAGLASSTSAAERRDEGIKALRALIGDLDQKLRVLERNDEIAREAAAAAKSSPTIAAGDGGFSLASADGKFQLRNRGAIHADARFFVGDTIANNDTFLIRRVRPSLEGTIGGKFSFRAMPDLAG